MPDMAALAAKYGGVPVDAAVSHPEALMGASQPGLAWKGDSSAVTLQDVVDNPGEAFSRIGASLKRDLTDPKLWLMAAASYFAPKVFNVAAPTIARTAAAASRGVGEVATPGMAKDLATMVGGSRVNAALSAAGRVAKGVKAIANGPAVAEPVAAPSAAPPVAAAPAPAPPAPAAEPPAPAPAPVAASAPAPAPAVKGGPPKLHLSVEEFQAAQQLILQGHPAEDVMKAIQRNRLPKAWLNLPSDAEVAAAVADRNASGRWPQDR